MLKEKIVESYFKQKLYCFQLQALFFRNICIKLKISLE
jgi:hypothetical protein